MTVQKVTKKERTGVVISDKMDKTVVVLTKSRIAHPKYGKIMVRRMKFAAHDEKETAKIGDVVRIRSTRPLSKTKNWKVVEVVKASKGDLKVNIAEIDVVVKKKKPQEIQS